MSTRASTRPTIPPSSPTPAPEAGLPGLDYDLLDLGGGRRLERFGERLVDRPAPAATAMVVQDPAAWARADLRWDRGGGDGPAGHWTSTPGAFGPWIIKASAIRLELRPTTSGGVGCYPEHAAVWDVVAEAVSAGRGRVLNLFAHTGGTTLAAAGAGAAVTHVDAARTAVARARRNATLSDLGPAPIRWIVDDATGFAEREVRRGRIYDAVVLDPPAYGHGTGARRWHLERDLPTLLAACRALGGGGVPPMVVLTSHSAALGPRDLAAMVGSVWGGAVRGTLDAVPLRLTAADGRALEAGTMVVAGA